MTNRPSVATKCSLSICVVIALAAVACASEATFEERAGKLLALQADSYISWSSENSFNMAHFTAQANFAMGRAEKAREIIGRAIERRPLVEYYDPEFPLWSTMDCYMRWKDVPGMYTPELKQKTMEYVAAAKVPSDATTYNHRWMLAAGLVLADQEWGDQIVSYRFSKEDPTGKGWALAQLERIVHRGHPETLADTYSQFEIGAILSLLNFCDDPTLKNRAKLTLDWIMLHRASYFMAGHTAGPTRRTYFPIQAQNNAQSPNWLYFGGPADSRQLSTSRPMIGCALSDYRPPVECMTVAWDHVYPYSILSSLVDYRTERLVSYVTDGYALFSQYNVKNNMGPRSSYYHEHLGWAVRWNAPPDRLSTFAIKHPCPKYRSRPLLGDTPFHQVLQHETALIGIVNTSDERPDDVLEESWQTHLLGAYPLEADALIDRSPEGRIFLHYGSVMIALCVTRPFEPVSDDKIVRFEIPAENGRLAVAYAVETASPSDYPGSTPAEQLRSFVGTATASFDRLRFDAASPSPEVFYRTVGGTELHLGWRPKGTSSIRAIDGRPIADIDDNARWPLLSTPYLSQPVNGNLILRTPAGSMEYDFTNWTVKRLP